MNPFLLPIEVVSTPVIIMMPGGESIGEPPGASITDANLTAGLVVCVVSTGHLDLPDGTEARATSIVGVAADTFAMGAVAKYAGPGQQLTGLVGLTPGQELYAGTGGALVPWASVPSGWWTRPVAIVDSTTSLRLQIGDVIHKD